MIKSKIFNYPKKNNILLTIIYLLKHFKIIIDQGDT
jgi:hypothetical protein